MANLVRVSVENPDEILNAGHSGPGAVVQIQSSEDNVTFADEGTVPVVSGTRVYTYYDANGTSGTWYRTRYETSAGTPTSDWSTAFQVGDETAGYICSIYDVEQRTGTLADSDKETALELIRAVTVEIEGYTHRDFTGDKSDVTFRVHTSRGRTLFYPRGIHAVTSLSVATESQPSTDGAYTLATATDYYFEPVDPEPGWPWTRIVFRHNATGSVVGFSDATFGAQIVGRRGFREVPADVQRVGVEMVLSAWLTKGSGEAERAVVGPSGQPVILRDPRHRAVLDRYRAVLV